jgi:hypothetical protein
LKWLSIVLSSFSVSYEIISYFSTEKWLVFDEIWLVSFGKWLISMERL